MNGNSALHMSFVALNNYCLGEGKIRRKMVTFVGKGGNLCISISVTGNSRFTSRKLFMQECQESTAGFVLGLQLDWSGVCSRICKGLQQEF